MKTKKIEEHTNKLIRDVTNALKVFFINIGIDSVPEVVLKPTVYKKNVLSISEIIDIANLKVDLVKYPEGILTRTRKRPILLARQVACYIARKTGYTLMEVADDMRINHATVIHSQNVVESLIDQNDPEMKKVYTQIVDKLTIYYKERYGKDLSPINN